MARMILSGAIPNIKNDLCNITASMSHKKTAKSWIVVDAENIVVGRLCSYLAKILKGKNKSDYTPHVDCGDYVVIINANKVVFTGKKEVDKIYYHHTGYPGGLKQRTPKFIRTSKNPQDIIRLGVQRMLSKGPLRNKIMTHLFIYSSAEHPHGAQNPKVIDFGSINLKNKFL